MSSSTSTFQNTSFVLSSSFLILLLFTQAFAFNKNMHQRSSIALSHSKLYNSAANAMIRKGKLKEVEALKKQVEIEGENSPINIYLKQGKFIDDYGEPIPFIESVYNRFQSVTVMPEYSKKVKTGFIMGMPDPEIMGTILRDAGAKSIVVCLDKRVGGASTSDFLRFVKDQSRSRKLLPGPISIVWNDHIVDTLQIAHAGSVGAAAVTLNTDVTDDLPNQIAYSKKLGIEPIVMIKTVEEGLAAISHGARVLCLHMLEEAELISVKAKLPADKEILYIARLRPESEYSCYAEIDSAWNLRDHGFSVIWPSPEAVYTTGFVDLYSILQAMKAKASRQFLSPRQYMMERKKEGATEYLGDILY